MEYKFYKSTLFTIFFLLSSLSIFAADFSGKDGLNRSIKLKKAPERIISLGAASTEILYEIGAENQIAAVSDVSDYPEAAKKLPVIGGFDGKTLSTEKLISFEPDFIIIYKGMHDFLIPFLEKYKIDYYVSDVQKVEQVIDEINNIAKLTGHQKKGTQLCSKYRNLLEKISAATDNVNQPSVYWEVWNEPFMSAGKNSFINDMICIAGGKNIFSNIEQPYPIVSEESIIAANPDYILIPASSRITQEQIQNRKGWNSLNAVINKNIILIDDNIYTRPGPRVFIALEELNSIIYGK